MSLYILSVMKSSDDDVIDDGVKIIK